jgi:signal transduction histidine kinase/ABC-type amino acid transport substrate-binding protein
MRILFAFLILLISFTISAQPSSWKTTLVKGKGTITIYWHGSEPFIFYDENGNLTGLEYDVFEGFADYLKQTHNIDLTINWVKAEAFSETFDLIKNEKASGFFGCSAFSITDNRKQEVDFSAPYLSDISVLISNKNIPIVANESEFKSVFSGLTAITIKGTTYEKYLKEISQRLGTNFKLEYIPSSQNILKTLALRENAFAFIDLPIYLTNLKNNPELHVLRQNVFPIKSEGYGFIMTKNSDWRQPFSNYLNSSYFNAKSPTIIGGYLQHDIYNLIKKISSGNQVNPDEEILLLTKEKEIQYKELLNTALTNQKNKTLINSIIAAFILAIIALVILYKVYVDKARSNKALQQQKVKIEQQQEDIEIQNKAIENRNDELIALNEEKNNLIHVLAHDLRTPINQIAGLVQLHTLQHKTLSKEDKFTFDTIMGSVERLNEMISKILDVEVIESQVPNINKEQLDVSKIIGEALEEFSKIAKKKSIKIKGHLPNEILVLGDRLYLRQIFDNLISNALKFSYPGTVINISAAENKQKVEIKIADQGPGFTHQDMKELFGKFHRLSAKPTAGEPSTGLGLSIVKKYVDLLNGTIECDSEMGKGAVFTIHLPVVEG